MMALKSYKSTKAIVIIILLLSISFTVYLFLKYNSSKVSLNQSDYQYSIENAKAEINSIDSNVTSSRNNAIVKAAHAIGPSVVSITTTQVQIVRDPWFDLFYPFGQEYKQKNYGLGSGFIFDKSGYILTNHHVITDADSIKVTLANGDEFKAKIIGSDFESDLAVLKIDSNSDLPIAKLGDSSDLMVGEWAIAIGNPFGFLLKDSQPTVTVGVISALDRHIQEQGRQFVNLIQTDASINPGNSGGPLVNCLGQVIGINTAIFSTSGGSLGVSFAIPINTAKRIIDELIKHGAVAKTWLGIEYQEINKEMSEHLGLSANSGLFIIDIVDGSPAEKGGLKQGDIVYKIDEEPIRTIDEANSAARLLKLDQEATFYIIRKGESKTLKIRVEKAESAGIEKAWFGITVQIPTSDLARRYGLSSHKKGVLVIQIASQSPAEQAKLQQGDLILTMSKVQRGMFQNFSIDEMEIKNIEDFKKFVSSIKNEQRIRIIFERRKEMWQTFMNAVRD
jgi:serine protease Do